MFNNASEIIIPFSDFMEEDIIIIMVGYHDFKYIEPIKNKRVSNSCSFHFVASGIGYYEVLSAFYKIIDYINF